MSQERRRTKRRPIMDSFSLFVVTPQKGPQRLKIQDVSEEGLGFMLESEGEPDELKRASDQFKVKEPIDLQLYLNPTLYLPMKAKIARIEQQGETRFVGVEFTDTKGKAHVTYLQFVGLLDQLIDSAKLAS